MDIAAAVDFDADGQLHPGGLGFAAGLIGVNIDQLDHPIAVRAAGRGEQIDQRCASDMDRLVERRRREAEGRNNRSRSTPGLQETTHRRAVQCGQAGS